MHAYLITGKSNDARLSHAKLMLEAEGVKEIYHIKTETKHPVATIRDINKTLSISGLHQGIKRGVLIEDAERLTDEAANAFLKSLEEPPSPTIFILTAPSYDLVLETIASRAQNIDLGQLPDEASGEEDITPDYLNMSLGERLGCLEKITTRDQGIDLCMSLIKKYHKKLLQTDTPGETKTLAKIIKKVEQTKYDLESNVNVKLAVGDLFLNMDTTK